MVHVKDVEMVMEHLVIESHAFNQPVKEINSGHPMVLV